MVHRAGKHGDRSLASPEVGGHVGADREEGRPVTSRLGVEPKVSPWRSRRIEDTRDHDVFWIAIGVLRARFGLDVLAASRLAYSLADLAGRCVKDEAQKIVDEVVRAE